jgi:hypothetical protein
VRDIATTILDVLGLILIAAGATGAAALVIGWFPALAVGGLVLIAGSLLSSWLTDKANTDGD